mmetsp:Transcript_18611/g.25916  ORF Transcript_18611/g.25916 Transcript_18611/m.25916 type:complete len:87 (-) Transcript_18611:95-355(-)
MAASEKSAMENQRMIATNARCALCHEMSVNCGGWRKFCEQTLDDYNLDSPDPHLHDSRWRPLALLRDAPLPVGTCAPAAKTHILLL